MNSTYKYLLEFLNLAIHNNDNVNNDNNDNKYEDLNIEELYNIAQKHKITSLIYGVLSNIKNLDKNSEAMKSWKMQSIIVEMNQIQRSMEFIKVYDDMLKKNIKPIVVKGIVCRNLYPNPDSRISGDEDILIREEDFKLCDEVLINNNIVNFENKSFNDSDVVTYFRNDIKLAIEVHKTLFNEDEEEHVHLFNEFYKNCFEEYIQLNINGQTVYTFHHTMNLLYLISHTAKHFLHGGVGIRQVCDIIKFIEVYHNEINWTDLWYKLKSVKYDYFTFALLSIGELYLGLNNNLVKYPSYYNKEEIDCRYLLEDILDAGIFGDSTIERKQSALITLDAVNNSNKSNSKFRFVSALFPSASKLQGRYSYLKDKPFLLPIAWCDRIYNYSKEKKLSGNVKDSAYKSISIGNKRVELLKVYKII